MQVAGMGRRMPMARGDFCAMPPRSPLPPAGDNPRYNEIGLDGLTDRSRRPYRMCGWCEGPRRRALEPRDEVARPHTCLPSSQGSIVAA
jgi:hypothetical protein